MILSTKLQLSVSQFSVHAAGQAGMVEATQIEVSPNSLSLCISIDIIHQYTVQ